MLGNSDVYATVAVSDMQKSETFYKETLGLKPANGQDQGGTMYKSGSTKIFVYPSQYAGTNQATTASWRVDDIDGVVKDLKSKGVKFEHYDMPNVTMQGDLHIMGELKAAWFKDPDGNILALVNR